MRKNSLANRNGITKIPTIILASLLLTGWLNPAVAIFEFSAPMVLITGDGFIGNVLSDMNGDNKPDLLVANWTDNTVAVLLGNGDGSFREKVSYATAQNPQFLAVNDLNGDGKPDFAVGAVNGNTVSVFLGNGDGTFQLKANYAIRARQVVFGDVNGDHRLDLIAGSDTDTGLVYILLGNGDGSFQTTVSYPTGSGAYGVALGDLNGDGKPDLAVTNTISRTDGIISSNTVSVLTGNGDGTFQAKVAYPTGITPTGITMGDLNTDSKPDLVTGNYDGTVSVLLGKGDGTFQGKLDFPFGWPFALGDINGDGKLDLATWSAGILSVLLGNGDATFQGKLDFAIGFAMNGANLADADGDGKLDLIAGSSHTFYAALGQG